MKHEYFILTEDHIKLLSNAYVSWDNCEFGAPEIDPKRPYGNSDVLEDMSEILGIDISENEENKLKLKKLHKETETALQIILSTKSFIPGEYIKEEYDTNWKLLDKK